MSGQSYEQLTLFQEDSHASRLVLPGSNEARKMTVISGQRCLELYRKSDPLGSLAKMLMGSSRWRSTKCYLTWKVSATPRKRLLFRLAPSMPRTGVTDARLSQGGKLEKWKAAIDGRDGQPILWKTPIASDAANRKFYHNSRGEPNLSGMVKMWPTPRAGGSNGKSKAGEKHGDLAAVVGGQLNPTWVEWLMGFPTGWTDLDASETL